MLDPDSTNPSDTENVPSAAPAGDPAPPRKRTPRKRAASKTEPADAPAALDEETPRPPRARAPRKARAAAAEPAVDPAAAAEPAPAQAAAPKPRKRAAKKAAPATEPPTAADLSAADANAAHATPAKKPARTRTPRKRTSAPTPSASDDSAPKAPAEPDLAPDEAAGEVVETPLAPAVVFQAPQPPELPEEPVPAGPDITLAEDAEDQVAEPEDVREVAHEQATGARRRKRRRRRGRGGSRADALPGAGAAGGNGEIIDAADEKADGAAAEAVADTDTADTDTADTADTDTADTADTDTADTDGTLDASAAGATRRRRRRRRAGASDGDASADDPTTVVHVRESRAGDDGVRGVKGSTRLEAKRQRRRDGRETTRRRAPILTEAEFLARREAVDRVMAVRQTGDRTQIAVLEDGVLVEHYVTRASATSYVGNVYLGRVQNVLPSMEAAFVDIGKGRNGVLYAGEVNWDAAGLEGKARAIEQALKSGDTVLVQVTKDPVGHKGARLTSQISLPGRFLVYVPGGGMTGISRRLPDTERHRLKAVLKKIVPDEAGVIVRTAAEGATEEELRHDVERLRTQWEAIAQKAKQGKNVPTLVHGEPDLAIRVVRDVFNEDFAKLVVQGDRAWDTVSEYVHDVAPDLAERVAKHTGSTDLFAELRVDEQILKALDRKVWLPSGGSLVIDRTEAMTVIDVNTGKFVGAGGNLEQTVTRNNLEAAEEIVRQLRLRDVGGIIVIDFIDMVLESNRDLVLRRLVECLGRDRTKHQVAEVTSLGLVQMTRKRLGEGLLEAFSEPCEVCQGRGVIVRAEPVERAGDSPDERPKGRRRRGSRSEPADEPSTPAATPRQREAANAAIAVIHRAAAGDNSTEDGQDSAATVEVQADVDEATAEKAPRARRRGRRAASRPAGPPVPAAG